MFDMENGNILWWDSILKEMKNVMIAFEEFEGDIKDIPLLIYTVLRLLAHCRYIHKYTKTMTSSFNLVTNLVMIVNCYDL